ncbi:MAG: methyltransferase [Nanoarchaeota archaeon]|nr:methyltransferase [Nanoarchaeota archaeon]
MTEHYFSRKPRASNHPGKVYLRIDESLFLFHTDASVFSKDRIDKGSKLLIKECRLPEKGDLLDLGCGYGPVGIAIAARHPELKITLSDVNQRALELAKKNAEENKVKVEIVESDLFGKLGTFDVILSNPPQHAGKELCIKLIEESKNHLNKGGTLQLVVRHQKGGRHLSEKMEEVFGNMEDIARQSGYHIYLSKKE